MSLLRQHDETFLAIACSHHHVMCLWDKCQTGTVGGGYAGAVARIRCGDAG